MKKLAFIAAALLVITSACKKDPVYPTASFTVTVSSYDNYTVYIDDYSSNASSYEWNWGDGRYDYSYTSSHTYASAGTYTITLKVTSVDGYTDMTSRTVTISSGSNPGGGGGDTPGGGGDTPGGGGSSTPTQVKITALKLMEFPSAPSSGSWDLAGKPDIYFKIMDGNRTTTYYTSSTLEDVTNSDCPLIWNNVNYTLYNLTATYNISFWDDDNIDTDELMIGCQWTPSSQNNNYTTYYNWANYSSNIDFYLYLTWYSSKGEPLYTKPVEYKNGQWLTNDAEVLRALNVER